MSYQVEAVTKSRILGEGPHWDDETQNLFFVDDFGSSIHRYRPSDNRETYCKVHESAAVSIVIPIKGSKNRFLVTIGRSLAIVTWDGESTKPDKVDVFATVDEEPGKEKNQFNDGKVDSSGRLWVGTIGPIDANGGWTPELGSLYSFQKNGKPMKHLSSLSIANGLIWPKDGHRFFYIDSPTKRIDVFDFDEKSGKISDNGEGFVSGSSQKARVKPAKIVLSAYNKANTAIVLSLSFSECNRRLFFDVSPHLVDHRGGPDGMTIDENDNLWVALFGTGAIINVNGTTGELIRKVELPVRHPTSVAFGGPRLDELYVTTASFGLTDQMKEMYPLSGCTLRVTGIGVKGRKANPADF